MNTLRPLYLPLEIDPSPLSELSRQRCLQEALSVAVKLDIFTKLKAARTAEGLANDLGVNATVTYYLLKALVEMGCLAVVQQSFRNTPLADVYLVPESDLYLGHEFRVQPSDQFAAQLLKRLHNEAGEMSSEPDWNQERLRQIGVFGLMGSIQNTVAVCDLAGSARLLDLGGGHGFYSIAFAEKYPELSVTLFDLPQVTLLAKRFIQQFKVESQVGLLAGNFLLDDIGTGYDAVLCANILHSTKRDIVLAKAYRALKEGGQLIVKCRVAEAEDNLENSFTNLLWQVRGGRELLTVEKWMELFTKYRFHDSKLVSKLGISATIIARK
ncbi:MAG: acetylserotonin O-methyltransferase [Pelosinus sp.]|nr:acetylserotonin O-methyltransferase [Pelosinus sp.]